MKTVATQVKRGEVLDLEGMNLQVLSAERNFKGRGGGSVNMKLKNLRTGAIITKNIRSGETLYLCETETAQLQYLYTDHAGLHFMHLQSYEQYILPEDMAGDFAKFLKAETTVHVMLLENQPVSLIPPKVVRLTVTEAEHAAKGDTSGNAKKPVEVETGATIYVPLFIKRGDTISINPENGEYLERVNS